VIGFASARHVALPLVAEQPQRLAKIAVLNASPRFRRATTGRGASTTPPWISLSALCSASLGQAPFGVRPSSVARRLYVGDRAELAYDVVFGGRQQQLQYRVRSEVQRCDT
jgi:hypothetical protein